MLSLPVACISKVDDESTSIPESPDPDAATSIEAAGRCDMMIERPSVSVATPVWAGPLLRSTEVTAIV